MATEVGICNLALAHLGEKGAISSIDPPEGGHYAEMCAQFYPIARDALIEMHPWGFATKRDALADIGSPYGKWRYRYRMPSDCIRLLAVYTPDTDDEQDFVVEQDSGGGVVLTNQEQAVARYLARVTQTTRYPALFVQALTWLLASYLSMSITRKADVQKAAYQTFATFVEQAKLADANQQHLTKHHRPRWVEARGPHHGHRRYVDEPAS